MRKWLSALLLSAAASAQAQTTLDAQWDVPLRVFWVPSGSMRPTLNPGDGVVAKRVEPGDLKRGDVIAFRVGGPREIWLSRLVGLPGDLVEVRNAQVFLNGQAVPQRALGAGPDLPRMGATVTRPSQLIEEHIPGAAAPHRILDQGKGSVDDAPPLRVPEGRLYVLGDNRDDAVDSRLTGTFGPGTIALKDVYGVVGEIMPSAFPVKPPLPPSSEQPPLIVPSR